MSSFITLPWGIAPQAATGQAPAAGNAARSARMLPSMTPLFAAAATPVFHEQQPTTSRGILC